MSAGVEQLKGSIPPLITPFHNGEVDLAGYAGLVDFQVEQGSHGILVNGTTSEPSTLTVEERNRLIDVAMEAVADVYQWSRPPVPSHSPKRKI